MIRIESVQREYLDIENDKISKYQYSLMWLKSKGLVKASCNLRLYFEWQMRVLILEL